MINRVDSEEFDSERDRKAEDDLSDIVAMIKQQVEERARNDAEAATNEVCFATLAMAICPPVPYAV